MNVHPITRLRSVPISPQKKTMDEATCLAEINYFTMKDLDFLAILLGYRLYIYMLSSYPNKYIYTDYISLLGNKAHYTGI